ncbi:MAG: ATP-binding cassette domain-containing protein [Verrucomicrobiota bacterium]
MNSDSLQLHEVTLRLGTRVLVASLSLTVSQGEVVTLMGESGCGKSSLLAYLCGTLSPAFAAEGTASMGGVNFTRLPPESRRLGILFQDDLLFPHMTVGQNLAFALSPSVRSRDERRMRIERALGEAGLAGFVNRDPATLSGGQRARVAVIRVLLSEPRALLLDEPFSKLDVATRQRFREFVFDHLRGRRLPTLLVTHDPDDAAAAGGRVIDLQKRTSGINKA